MYPSTLISDLAFVAASTWISLGVGVALGLGLAGFAPLLVRTGDPGATRWKIWHLRGGGIGVAAGTAAGAVLVFVLGADRGGPAPGFILLPAAAGALLGAAIAGFLAGSLIRATAGSRAAHSRAVSMNDYVRPFTIWSARVLVSAAALATLLEYVIVLTTPPEFTPPIYPLVSSIVVIPAVVALVVTEIGVRRLVSRPSSAASPAALRQEDLRRTLVARESVASSMALAILAVVLCVPALGAAFAPRATIGRIGIPEVVMLLAWIMAVVTAVSLVPPIRASILGRSKGSRARSFEGSAR